MNGEIDRVVAWVMARVGVVIRQMKLVIRKADFGSILAAVALIVSVVEEAAKEFKGLDGEQKKKVAATVLNRLIDIPYVPETVEGWMFGMLIDWVVDALNVDEWKLLAVAEAEGKAKAEQKQV